jgi:hypothetical protein
LLLTEPQNCNYTADAMPPKKAAAAQPVKPKTELPQCGLAVEMPSLPLWDDAELEKEAWGDLHATHVVDAAALYVDQEMAAPVVEAFQQCAAGVEWKRPSAIFSPFKPVVYRQAMVGNPYEFDAKASMVAAEEDEEQPQPTTRTDMIELYRSMKPFRSGPTAGPGEASGDGGGGSPHQSSRRRQAANAAKRRDKSQATPFFMRAFNSALMVLNHHQRLVPQGAYAWELIYPQAAGTNTPQYNPTGKYCVKLFVSGAFRRVMIDDKLPTDSVGQCVLTVTEQKEIWPALLAKAMLKALGPAHEHLLFNSAPFVVSTLLCGWTPQAMNPAADEVMVSRAIRWGMQQQRDARAAEALLAAAGDLAPSTPKGAAKPALPAGKETVVLCATCHDSTAAEPAAAGIDDECAAAGLHANQVYHIMDIRPFQNSSLLRLCTPAAQWKGTYSYDGNAWSDDFEAGLGFSASKDRSAADLANKWNDFWITWETFVKMFRTCLVFRNVNDRRYQAGKQVLYVSDAPAAEAAPSKASKADKGAAVAPPAPVNEQPKAATKWVSFNNEAPTSILITTAGLPRMPKEDRVPSSTTPVDSKPAATAGGKTPPAPAADASQSLGRPHRPLHTVVTVQSYDWRSSQPLFTLAKFSSIRGAAQSRVLTVPAGLRAYKVTVDNLYPGAAVSVMAPTEFTLGDEKDVVRDILGVFSTTDAGVYGVHAPNAAAIWFKRHITVKQPTSAHFVLSTLPKGTDLAQYRAAPPEAPAGKGKEKAKPAAKGAPPPPPAESINDQIDDAHHDRPITDFATLSLIDLDTGAAVNDTVGKILNTTLTPNAKGYVVIARATAPEQFGKGYWRLACTSDRALDTFDARAFEEVQQRGGGYVHNDASSLFRLNFTVAEAATTTLLLSVAGPWRIPYTLTLYRNDKVVDERAGAGDSRIDHAILVANEKATASVYSVQCTLDRDFTASWEEQRRRQVEQLFKQDASTQEAQLLVRQAALQAHFGDAATAQQPAPEVDAAAAAVHVTEATAIKYQLSFHSSTAKMDIKEDNLVNESLHAIKLSWCKKDAPDVPVDPKAKKAAEKKGAPVVDESALRFAKAKEARDKFMANRKGVFMPYLHPATGKPVLAPEEEPGMPNVAMAAPTVFDASGRLHGGLSMGGAAMHGGTCSPRSGAAAAVPAAADLAAPPMAKMLDDAVALAAANKESRKGVLASMNEALYGFWAEVMPDAVIVEAPVEDEKVTKKPPAKGKK